LAGDRIHISPKCRLFIQFIAAFALLSPILVSDPSSDFCPLSAAFSPWIRVLGCLLLSILVVGTANFYNFMDGINGIAGMTGGVGFALLGFYAFRSGSESSAVVLAICMSLACLGFLPLNVPRARVFMGDVGSILLGFVFAGMVVWLTKSLLDFICMTAFIFPFYADELSTMVIRLRDHSPREMNLGRMRMLAKPHRRHVYQLLANEMSIAHWKVSVAYGVFQAIVGIGALAVSAYGMGVLLGYLGIWIACFWVFSSRVRTHVLELVTQEKLSVGIERQTQRTPEGGKPIEIREIIGPSKHAEKKADRKTAAL